MQRLVKGHELPCVQIPKYNDTDFFLSPRNVERNREELQSGAGLFLLSFTRAAHPGAPGHPLWAGLWAGCRVEMAEGHLVSDLTELFIKRKTDTDIS